MTAMEAVRSYYYKPGSNDAYQLDIINFLSMQQISGGGGGGGGGDGSGGNGGNGGGGGGGEVLVRFFDRLHCGSTDFFGGRNLLPQTVL